MRGWLLFGRDVKQPCGQLASIDRAGLRRLIGLLGAESISIFRQALHACLVQRSSQSNQVNFHSET
jgi:hypothetical protein